MASTRRLAAILAADVAGFYSLIDADSDGTLRALKAIRRDLVDPTIEGHNGRLLKTTGDLLLVEFSNVVDALRCATDLQRTLAEHNRTLPPGERIEFRIGIHQGDVVIQDGYHFSDGVNIATDLEGLAQPGGICFSARAKEDAEGKLTVQFEDMGEQWFKNRSRHMRTYQISPAAASNVGVSERATRRLAAILPADVVAYSRLMGADEEGTHERLKAHCGQLVEPKVKEHRGRIVKNTGDGMLVEFSSVVDAVRCAVEVQRGMAEREPSEPEERRIRFRIGVNLGDVIVEEHDIFGDGVNVAARLEGLAEAGGICISRMVRDQIRDKLPYQFEDLGEQSVKNIARPVRVYAWSPEVVAELPVPKSPPPVTTISPSAVAPRLSIVVLPFTNLSNDPEQQYFTDGITEDLTSDLSRITHNFVISCNTAFTYRNKRVDTKQIGRELGVRYVLEGSVRRWGNQLRVNAQLIDAATDAHLWAERFDHDIGDLFALQNEITSCLANALGVELIAAEAARLAEHPDTLDYILRGRAAGLKPYSRENQAEQISLFEHALALDPQSVEAQIRLANALVRRVLNGTTGEAMGDLRRAEGLVGQALAAKPRNAYGHFVKGFVLHAQNRWQEAVPEFETALALDRNMVSALHELGACKVFTGLIDEVIPLVEQAIHLSPRDPDIGLRYFQIGTVHLLQSRTDEAIVWLEKARSAMPASPLNHSWLASAYALKGKTEPAAAELAEAGKLDGGDLFSSIAHLKAHRWRSWGPKIRALFEATYFAGLRKAGMPEE
jgi:adenylate cyclase